MQARTISIQSVKAASSDGAADARDLQVKLSTENLSLYYGAFRALADVNFRAYANQVTAIIGPSGCGTVSYTHLTLPTIYSV